MLDGDQHQEQEHFDRHDAHPLDHPLDLPFDHALDHALDQAVDHPPPFEWDPAALHMQLPLNEFQVDRLRERNDIHCEQRVGRLRSRFGYIDGRTLFFSWTSHTLAPENTPLLILGVLDPICSAPRTRYVPARHSVHERIRVGGFKLRLARHGDGV